MSNLSLGEMVITLPILIGRKRAVLAVFHGRKDGIVTLVVARDLKSMSESAIRRDGIQVDGVALHTALHALGARALT